MHSTLIQTIQKAAREQAEACIAGAKRRQQDALRREQAKAEEETRQWQQSRFAEIREEAGRRICAAENAARASLFHRREAIRREVMEKTRAAVEAFTQSDRYEAFLLASASAIHQRMAGDCAVLNMRAEDRPFAAAVSARLGHSITLHIDPAITLGGITVISGDGSLLVDDTLDRRLAEQQTWFEEHSGLVIE